MIKIIFSCLIILGTCCLGRAESTAMSVGGLIDSVLAVRQRQIEAVEDMAFDAVFYERRTDGNGNITEEKRYDKKIFVKNINDSFHIHQQYRSYYLDGVQQPREDLIAQVEKKQEERRKRGGRDFNYDMTIPLRMLYTGMYDVSYKGIAEEKIEGYTCYKLSADAREENDTLMNCLYYVDTASYNLVRIDFSPAKLTKKLMFKLSRLDMTIYYSQYDRAIWIPRRFELNGKGKAAFFVNVYFQSEETYTNPAVNSGLDDAIFENRVSVEEI